MISVVTSERIPVKLWLPLDEVDALAMSQLTNLASMPGMYKHVVALPGVHGGYGMPVEAVIATEKSVIPAAVGTDIGCGMMAVMLPFCAAELPDNLQGLFDLIAQLVPVGQAAHDHPLQETRDLFFGSGLLLGSGFQDLPDEVRDEQKAATQLGTLGGGNHFIEVCLDREDQVWVMLHSGSRGIGHKIGTYYIDRAKSLMDTWQITLRDPQLAYLAEGTEEFEAYWRDLQWAQDYAMFNRQIMMDRVLTAITRTLAPHAEERVEPKFTVNCHHNYAEREHHFGRNVIVTRKGAIRARPDDYGIIPGSMGARSYIVRGRGNPDTFCSCSHGAGRRLTRTEAMAQFTTDDLVAQTAGVVCNPHLKKAVEEIPAAYKNIEEVVSRQTDSVEVIAELKQVLCVKG
jgi:tRNA-splicing ligase RtcB (3'-phosphate/5'-hydroxy nucleic acid ligase)